jgi:prepilin-type N-terminal cleavage/methylation domain-containing protein/prepilin-type processing-associated H-X9-DG protein
MKRVPNIITPVVSPRNGKQAPLNGFTLIEVLITVAIVVILVSIGFPAWKSLVASSKNAKCISNLRQIGVGMSLYVADNSGMLLPGAEIPTGTKWFDNLEAYIGKTTNLASSPLRPLWQQCPEKSLPPGEWNVGYGWNFQNFGGTDPANWGSEGEYARLVSVPEPARTIIIGCTPKYFPGAVWRNGYIYKDIPVYCTHHAGGGNYLFLDWHIERVKPADVPFLLKRNKAL